MPYATHAEFTHLQFADGERERGGREMDIRPQEISSNFPSRSNDDWREGEERGEDERTAEAEQKGLTTNVKRWKDMREGDGGKRIGVAFYHFHESKTLF